KLAVFCTNWISLRCPNRMGKDRLDMDSWRPSRPRGRAFIGAKRRALTEEANGSGPGSGQEGRAGIEFGELSAYQDLHILTPFISSRRLASYWAGPAGQFGRGGFRLRRFHRAMRKPPLLIAQDTRPHRRG